MIAAIHDPASIGVSGYVARLAAALEPLGVDYRPYRHPVPAAPCHFHLANSTRRVIPWIAVARRRFLLTVHDVLPRAIGLRPLQRAVVLPLCARRASRIVVHSQHAADLLLASGRVDSRRIVIVPLAAPVPADPDRARACEALGIAPEGPPLCVLPGTLKSAKLVDATLVAAAPLIAAGRMRLLLAGAVADETLPARAAAVGATLIRQPDTRGYESAIVAADVVLALRADSVGESNGPLLDAIGAGRPSLVTGVGSAREIAGDAAWVVAGDPAGIAAGLEALLDPSERTDRAAAAAARARALTWDAAARAHAMLLGELNDG